MNESNYRTELIQAAAVAVSIVEDLDYGSANSSKRLGRPTDRKQSKKTQTAPILAHIYEERQAQDTKWGPKHHSPAIWLAILMEEVGEIADEIDDGDAINPGLAWIIHRMGTLGKEAKKWLERNSLG